MLLVGPTVSGSVIRNERYKIIRVRRARIYHNLCIKGVKLTESNSPLLPRLSLRGESTQRRVRTQGEGLKKKWWRSSIWVIWHPIPSALSLSRTDSLFLCKYNSLQTVPWRWIWHLCVFLHVRNFYQRSLALVDIQRRLSDPMPDP